MAAIRADLVKGSRPIGGYLGVIWTPNQHDEAGRHARLTVALLHLKVVTRRR